MPGRVRDPLILNPTLQIAAVVETSRRGVGRRQLELTDARAVAFLLTTLACGGRRPRLDPALRRRLRDAGVLIRRRQLPRDVLLDARLRADSPLSPGFRLHRGPDLLPALARRARTIEPFLPAAEILWMPRPGSGIMLPYTLTPGLARTIRRRRASAEDPRRRGEWAARVRGWRAELRSRGFAVLRGVFDAVFAGALRTYYRRLEAEGYLLGGDRRRRGAPLLYGEPLLDFLGAQLARIVGAVTGDRAPSHSSFVRVYDPGAVLASHRDRPVCRWTVDLVVGGEPAPERRTAWPLWMQGRRGAESVRLALGEGVLYRGDRVAHWRRPQPRGRTTTVASLHYGRAATR